MRILGIDPGSKTTGWALFDTEKRTVVWSCETDESALPTMLGAAISDAESVVIESVHEPHGYIQPSTVVSGIVQGQIEERIRIAVASYPDRMTRHEVKTVLTAETLRTVVVKDDKTAWSALALLFGHDSDRKPKRKKGQVIVAGGPLGEVKGHARAALAVAVAWWLRHNGGKL